ncbi:MAG: methyltransferase domain-containing protein [Oscillospiraceae bacterium]|nr:methyltransferase domain-containing protein [Oscillospiraceae bacterium]
MSFWDKVSGIYDLAESLNKKAYREMLCNTARLVPTGAKVLDCAAGTGELSIAASKNAESVISTDLSEKMLETAEKKCRRKGINNIFFDTRDIFSLDDADESYDVVIAGNVLHLIENPENAIKELARVTKKGGRLILPTFLVNDKMPAIRLYKLLGYNQRTSFTVDSYLDLLENAEIGDIHLKVIDGVIPVGYAVINKKKEAV